jgi:hypothetical protein
VNWIVLAQDSNRWRALVKSVLNLWVPWNAGKLSSGLTSGGLSSNARLYRVSYPVIVLWGCSSPPAALLVPSRVSNRVPPKWNLEIFPPRWTCPQSVDLPSPIWTFATEPAPLRDVSDIYRQLGPASLCSMQPVFRNLSFIPVARIFVPERSCKTGVGFSQLVTDVIGVRKRKSWQMNRNLELRYIFLQKFHFAYFRDYFALKCY